MSGTTSTSTPVCTIDADGLHAPLYADIWNYLVTQYQSIYGSDVYLGNDSQDGQFLALIASAIHDCNSSVAAVYLAFSPATAIGAGLSTMVKINNMRRQIATNSTVDLVLVGQAQTPITNGIARDANQNLWLLPASVTIPDSGTITVTAIAQNPGQVSAPAGSITKIATPVVGWQSVTNPTPASAGYPIEDDASLRVRQQSSTALPSQSILDGIIGDIKTIAGVNRCVGYENDTGTTDPNGIPPYSISFVVDGGDALEIATAIAVKKTQGAPTYGTTSEIVTDSQGQQHTIQFFRPTQVPITVALTIGPLPNYQASSTSAVAAAIAAFISSLPIGRDVFRTQLYPSIFGAVIGDLSFYVSSLAISRTGTPQDQDVSIAFNEAAVCTVDNVSIIVLPVTTG